jgi:hypothetical protein
VCLPALGGNKSALSYTVHRMLGSTAMVQANDWGPAWQERPHLRQASDEEETCGTRLCYTCAVS